MCPCPAVLSEAGPDESVGDQPDGGSSTRVTESVERVEHLTSEVCWDVGTRLAQGGVSVDRVSIGGTNALQAERVGVA